MGHMTTLFKDRIPSEVKAQSEKLALYQYAHGR